MKRNKDERRVKKMLPIWLSVVLILLFSVSWKNETIEAKDNPPEIFGEQPKNLIFLIGDGMGLTQISTLNYVNKNFSNFEKFPVIGFQKTYSADNLVTDSAAAATAMGCGVKTKNTIVGMTADSIAVQSCFEEGKAKGLAIGLVVSAAITHATPAGFYAHQPSRGLTEKIALDLVKSDFDFFVGGGKQYFIYRYYDNRNLLKELEKKGYKVTNRRPKKRDLTCESKIAWFTAAEQPVKASEGRKYMPEATQIAASFLNRKSSEKGFMLMVEGSQIDWAGHAKNREMLLNEMKDFNKVLEKVLAFAEEDKETLVIVTGDHECGGLAINSGKLFSNLKLDFTTRGHTGSMIPVFAYGPGAEYFTGIYENTDIYKKIRLAMGWELESAGVR